MTRVVESATCLGCGCACDDIRITVRGDAIVDAERACPLGRAWFGDGRVPMAVLRGGEATSLDSAIALAADLLVGAAGRLAVYVGADVSCETQRTALALADVLRGTVDSAISATAAAGLLAAQHRGRAVATLGEIRNRADLLVFWGVDPSVRYPRYTSRYALDPIGTHVPDGRAGRRVVSVTIGDEPGPSDADVTLALSADDEIAALAVMRAVVLGHTLDPLPTPLRDAAVLATRMVQARYAVVAHDAEPGAMSRDSMRTEALIALTQALNGPTRAALSSLRAGGNRSGADAVFTWQTGYPFGVSYTDGAPRYRPNERLVSHLGRGSFGAVLLVGSMDATMTSAIASSEIPVVVIGPRASEAAFTPAIAIDTGIAGIHEGGTAYRMDEVPLPLRASLPEARSAAATLGALLDRVRARREQRP